MINVRFILLSLFLFGSLFPTRASEAPVYGPFGAKITGKGAGYQGWFQGSPPTEPKNAWSMSVWVKPDAPILSRTLVAGFGDGLDLSGSERFFSADSGGWYFFLGSLQIQRGRSTAAPVPSSEDALTPDQVFLGRLTMHEPVTPNKWQLLSATYDGSTLRLFVNGEEKSKTEVPLARAAMEVLVAPPPPWDDGMFFSGSVAGLTIWDRAIGSDEIRALLKTAPDEQHQPDVTLTQTGAAPMRRVGPFMGTRSAITPQKPATMPQPLPVMETTPKRLPKLASQPLSETNSAGELVLNLGWELQEVSLVSALPEAISSPGLDTSAWYDATVPGTVLTTLVRQGVYPDPLYGLNNLLIPDNLSRKSWWYRVAFKVPQDWNGRKVNLTLHGINYHAEGWLNGRSLGDVTGAFIRGSFDATPFLKPGETNVFAVRVWPQPHNGAAVEESLRTDAGPNGADGTLDGPTFFCTEGWDWIPTIRDRCTGIWQDVVLRPTGPVVLGDSKVTTELPRLPDLSVARITIESELKNLTDQPQRVTLQGSVAGASFKLPVSLQPHETAVVTIDPKQFPQLDLKNPKLWWPNGYGEPTLHDFTLQVLDEGNKESDHSFQRVGLRTITASYDPLLTLSVNGRRVFCKGGNWGLDDAMKRISREELEPYIRLHRDANITMIRNWCGQSQSETLFGLCDEYGLLVFNEFWLTTGNFDMAAFDADLFMANATDTVKRYRNHASIALWCARNEGNPPPWLADRLADLLQKEDDTRPYVPKSTGFPVTGGGPYYYVDPKTYFTLTDKKNFKTELGVNSVPTAGAMRAMMDKSQLWPISDSWAYHDFHDNGSDYLKAVNVSFGESKNLDSFVKRAQMINYVNYRAMFEAWNARLWKYTSGVLIWMTHPSWPSTIWQIYTHDYDTHASFYGTKKACEPVHIQWNLNDDSVAVINNLQAPLDDALVTVSLVGMNGKELKQIKTTGSFPGEAATVVTHLVWPVFPSSPVVFLKLVLRDKNGKLLSENFYWHSDKPEDLKALNTLPSVKLDASVDRVDGALVVSLKNNSKTPSLMTHLSLMDGKTGKRILPAYYEDNYISLFPGDSRSIRIETGGSIATDAVVDLEGWNIAAASLKPNP
ncbi:MAG: glycoside hydrolase family 2 [Proteobacteria bacterium]|nr:glycoside hydrolase family 2 [Pseudomonadota bacterium]